MTTVETYSIELNMPFEEAKTRAGMNNVRRGFAKVIGYTNFPNVPNHGVYATFKPGKNGTLAHVPAWVDREYAAETIAAILEG